MDYDEIGNREHENDMITNIPVWLAVALTTVLPACVPATPRLDAQFGAAVDMARARQTANPDASRNTDVVKGIDGQAGAAAVNNYHESFTIPRPGLVVAWSTLARAKPEAGAEWGADNHCFLTRIVAPVWHPTSNHE